jgi:hypothetical protein
LATWSLGEPDRAVSIVEKAIEIATDRAHPFTLTWATAYLTVLHRMRRDDRQVQVWARRVGDLAAEYDFHQWRGLARILGGLVAARRSGGRAALDELHAEISHQPIIERPMLLSQLAVTALHLGDARLARVAIEESLAGMVEAGCRHWESEILRLNGVIRMEEQDLDRHEGEVMLLRAVEVAREQRSRMLELRASVSLARVWHHDGRSDKARSLIAPLIGTFEEGAGTRDLQEGYELLAAIG